MELEAISGAAIIAVCSTIVFLIAAKAWNAASRVATGTPSFSARIMPESAQRLRDEVQRLASSQSAYLGAALVFLLLFGASWMLDAGALFAGYPTWQLYLQLAFLSAAGVIAAIRLVRTVWRWRQARFMRDASIAIGHQLKMLPPGFARLFHDVPTTAGVIDHLLIGQNGIYAINVFAIRAAKNGEVNLRDNQLEFSGKQAPASIVAAAAAVRRLEKEFRQALGQAVRVRSVIAIPGWEISQQTSNEHLLVNERTIPVLSGWKDNSDYLMNEDVDVLLQDISRRCRAA